MHAPVKYYKVPKVTVSPLPDIMRLVTWRQGGLKDLFGSDISAKRDFLGL